MNLYRMEVDFGRMGIIDWVFLEESKVIEESIGKTVHLGEVLGKHSDVFLTLDSDAVKLLSSDPIFVEKFKETVGSSVGGNPIEFLD